VAGGDDILVEFVVQGSVVRVTAFHAASGAEAVIVGPASAPRSVLEAAVSRKLAYIMRKDKNAE
jgi:hypothetical protein